MLVLGYLFDLNPNGFQQGQGLRDAHFVHTSGPDDNQKRIKRTSVLKKASHEEGWGHRGPRTTAEKYPPAVESDFPGFRGEPADTAEAEDEPVCHEN